jgi:hypothetical protein
MVDYRDEVRLGKEVLSRTVEAYRKIRNTFRYLLSNLYDFDPAVHSLPREQMLAVDRYALSAYARLAADVRRAYEAYNFQAIAHAINEFVTVNQRLLSRCLKDRFTFGRLPRRRSAQTAVYLMAASGPARRPFCRRRPVKSGGACLAGRPPSTWRCSPWGGIWRTALDADWQQLLAVRTSWCGSKVPGSVRIGNRSLSDVAAGTPAELLGRTATAHVFIMQVRVTPGWRRHGNHGRAYQRRSQCWRFVAALVAGGRGICERCAHALERRWTPLIR